MWLLFIVGLLFLTVSPPIGIIIILIAFFAAVSGK